MKTLLCLILSLLLILPPLPTLAWSECGHHIIAVMAFRKLPAERQIAMGAKTNKFEELHISEDYLKNAGHVAQIQPFQAAARLADQLN